MTMKRSESKIPGVAGPHFETRLQRVAGVMCVSSLFFLGLESGTVPAEVERRIQALVHTPHSGPALVPTTTSAAASGTNTSAAIMVYLDSPDLTFYTAALHGNQFDGIRLWVGPAPRG